ncbi:MAG TPA: radical SAM protein [Dissulfurispiraceae bacterium]|nr:radical SAM protein [Dissulfurispiraceae bacterium]
MKYFFSKRHVLRRLECPSVYCPATDELYELDETGFDFLMRCALRQGCESSGGAADFIDFCVSEGILTVDRVSADRPPISQSPIPSLRYLELQITDRCNLRCRHCYLGESGNRELSMIQLKAVLDEFEAMQGLRLLITGGEPLMYSQFSGLNRMLTAYSFRKILFTNGLLLNEKLLEHLNFEEIQISVDGLEHGHDAIRGKGTFRKVMRNIEAAVGAGYAVSISTMIHNENLTEFEGMETLFKGLGVRDWTVDVPCSEGSLKDNDVLGVPPEIGGKLLRFGFGEGLHEGAGGYGCGLHLAAVLADGKICKCAFYARQPAGNINDGLAGAWAKIRPVRLGELECARVACEAIDECRGGCRYRASLTCRQSDDADAARDLYKCFHYGIMK